jgi:UDP:flavonoid glycosyltransferase YjiC (YdhE family)
MSKRILIAPLDWGLGHATRCIPIIRMLLQMNHEVLIAGSGNSLELLKKEFPALPFAILPAYDPEYPTNGSMVWKMASQLPKFLRTIIKEHRAIDRYIADHKIDLVISDNRYGCWTSKAPSIFITHQSNIMMPERFGWLAPGVKVINGLLMKKFDICWIPDFPDGDSLAGNLVSFGRKDFHPNVRYVGMLSRFGAKQDISKEYDILAICSGPEPQRSEFERIVSAQLEKSGKEFLLVRGVIQEGRTSRKVNYMTSAELEETIAKSEIVISRSGYSTIMDLKVMGKKAILIPTPCQTEQEYLARILMERKICFCMSQEQFDLETALRESGNYSGFTTQLSTGMLSTAIHSALADRPK